MNYVPKNEGVVAEAWIEDGELMGQTAVIIDYLETPKGIRGLGRSEFENILSWAKTHDVNYITIESEPEAVGFWKKMGFEIVGDENSELKTMTYHIKNQFAISMSKDPNHCPQRYEDTQTCKDTSCVCLPALLKTPRKCEDCGVDVNYSWMGAYCKECLQTGSGLFQ